MKKPRLIGSEFSGEGEAKFPDDWKENSAMLRADLLRDWIYDLQKEYASALDEIFPSNKKKKR